MPSLGGEVVGCWLAACVRMWLGRKSSCRFTERRKKEREKRVLVSGDENAHVPPVSILSLEGGQLTVGNKSLDRSSLCRPLSDHEPSSEVETPVDFLILL